MIDITAKDVNNLRKMTGAGMMDCKSALVAAKGDVEAAKDLLRKRGTMLADKKSGREANQGLVGVKVTNEAAYIAIVNCETDFVARNEKFQAFVREYLEHAEKGSTISDEDIVSKVAELGENIELRGTRTIKQEGALGVYVHNKISEGLGTIGVIVSLKGTPTTELGILAHSIAMHIAAANPKAIDETNLDPEFVAKERKFLIDQALESGKPANIVEKMVDGRMRKMLKEVTLVDQPYVINPEETVGKLLKEANAEVVEFVRIAIGE